MLIGAPAVEGSEVDKHTEPAAVVARKVENYRRFFQRTVKDHHGVDVAF
ncbi:replication-relaxation family protein [Streptomyces sp. NBC_01341]|nr:replication-relaxation family protein [Streptomyces sp. NBC_01341]